MFTSPDSIHKNMYTARHNALRQFNYSSRRSRRLGAWFWSASADIFLSKSPRILAERI